MKRGTVVSERYTVQVLAGTGGMGSVYRAIDPEGRPVAVKVLSGGRQRMDLRFAREARILMRLKHSGIVRCLDSGVTPEGQRFLVMEWLDGVDVESCLHTRPFTLEQGLELGEVVAGALGFLHEQGMVHRDIKPSNIFLPNGDVSNAKLLDFGVAHWTDATSLTATGMQVGTPSYMAPEQIRGDGSIGPMSDVFSLGCVLFKCLTGQTAFEGSNRVAVFYKILLNDVPRIAELMVDVPSPVSELLERMLAKDVADRHQNGSQVAEHIARVRAELAESTRGRLQRTLETPIALTTSERQLVSVIVVSRLQDGDADLLGDLPGSMAANLADNLPGANLAHRGVTMLLENHSQSEEILATLRDLRARHESVGVSFNSLADGSLIGVLDSRQAATDQAAAAARCALELSNVLVGHPVAIATGHAESDQSYHRLDDVIECAVAMLSPEHQAQIVATAEDCAIICLDEMTAGLLEGRFEMLGEPGNQMLMRESHMTDGSVLMGHETPFVGRKREMATLSALLEECVDEHVARAALITGPPGIGKSRLQREFIQSIADDDIELWHGRGDPMLTASPLEVIAQAILGSAGISEDQPLEVRRNKLRERVARSVEPERVEQVSAFIGKLIKTSWSFDTDVQLRAANADARLMGDRVRQACEELLSGDLDKRPVLLLIDDFQWCSRATAAWIDRVLRNLSERPLMVVAFARPEVHDLFPDLWASHDPDEVRLRTLSRRAAQEFIRAVLGRDFSGERAAQLVERADGNALYLEGLVRGAMAGREDLPDSMLAMVHSRLNELQPPVRRALRAASIFGKRFWVGGLAALLGDSKGIEECLHSLLVGELIDEASASKFAEQEEYRFRHDVIREAAYNMLTDEDRCMGHRLAGAWLERTGETDALVVAVHYERGGALEQALHFFEQAAEHACHNGDFVAAVSLAERGMVCGAEGEALGALHEVQAKAYYWNGRLQHAASQGVQAIALLRPGSHAWYEAIEITSLARAQMGQAYEVERYARTLAPPPIDDSDEDEYEEQWMAPPPPRDHDRSGWLRLSADLAGHLFQDGRVDIARALITRVEMEIGDLDEAAPWLAARIHRAWAIEAMVTEGNPATTMDETLSAVSCYDKAGDARHACLEMVNVARAQLELGLFDEADETLRHCLAKAEGLAVDFLIDLAKLYHSVTLAHRGQLREAIAMAESCVENFEERGHRRVAATAYIHLARFYLLDGSPDAAESAANLAVASCSRASPVYAYALAQRASLLLANGREVEALNATVQAMTLMESFGSVDEGEAFIRLVYAEALQATEQEDAARIAIIQARNRLRRRARSIDRGEWRKSFLHKVRENARTFELATEWTTNRTGA